jgi:putative transferase (TIGR04331 family)
MKKKLILASSEKLLDKNYINYSISSDIYSLSTSILKKFSIKAPYSHWKHNQKKKRDYIYLKKLYYSVLKDLVKYLNSYHSIKYNENQWHIILGPWLNYIIPILWDRWETVNVFEKKFGYIKKISIPENPKDYLISDDFINFTEKFERQDWNAEIFRSIIDFKKKKWNPIYKKKKIYNNYIIKKKFKKYLVVIDKILFFLQKLFLIKNNYIFVKTNFEKRFYIEAFFKHLIITRFYTEFDKDININRDKLDRNENFISLKFVKFKSFEKYLSRILIKTIPLSYLENFKLNLNIIKKIKIKNKIIITTFKHYENDLFKIWLANEKKKLVSCLHGGNIEKEFFFDSWSKYSYKYISWNKDKLNKNQINLPVNFLIFRKKFENKEYLHQNKIIFLLPHAELKPLRLVDGLFCFEVLDCIDTWISFYKILDDNKKKFLHWRFGPFPDRWRILEKLSDRIQNIKFSKEKKFEKDVLKARLSIHVDIQTTFLETMYMNIPSIIIMNNNFWNVSKKSFSILKKLKSANILFHNYKDMANHINKYYSNIDAWWESNKVQKIRLDYLRYSGTLKTVKAKHVWFNFLKKMN